MSDIKCEYCHEIEMVNPSGRTFFKELPHDTKLLTTLDDDHLQIALDTDNYFVLHFENNYGDCAFDVRICACPKCGRKLLTESEVKQ